DALGRHTVDEADRRPDEVVVLVGVDEAERSRSAGLDAGIVRRLVLAALATVTAEHVEHAGAGAAEARELRVEVRIALRREGTATAAATDLAVGRVGRVQAGVPAAAAAAAGDVVRTEARLGDLRPAGGHHAAAAAAAAAAIAHAAGSRDLARRARHHLAVAAVDLQRALDGHVAGHQPDHGLAALADDTVVARDVHVAELEDAAGHVQAAPRAQLDPREVRVEDRFRGDRLVVERRVLTLERQARAQTVLDQLGDRLEERRLEIDRAAAFEAFDDRVE